MPDQRKSVVVDIISDSKKFLSGFEESIKEVEKAAKKANILGNMQDDINELKSGLKAVSDIVGNIKVSADDSSLLKLQQKIETIDISIQTLKDSVKNIKIEVDEASAKGLEKIIHQTKANVIGAVDEMKQATAFLSDVFNIKTSNSSLDETSQKLSQLRTELNEFKKIKDQLSNESNIGYSNETLKNAANKFDELKLKYENIISAQKELKKQIDSGQSIKNGGKQLNDYAVELAIVSKELLAVQDRLYDFNSFEHSKLFADGDLEKAIKNGENVILKRISNIESKIKDLGSKTINAIDEEITKLEVKDGKIRIPVELDKTVGKLKNTLYELLASIQAAVNPITVPIQLVSAYKTNAKNEINELKEIQALQNGIDQLTDETEKRIAQSTLDKIKAQFEKELRLDIKTNIGETQKAIESGINKIRTILKKANIFVPLRFEIEQKARQDLLKKLYKFSDSISFDITDQIEQIQTELTTMLDNGQVDSWAENFIQKLDVIYNKFKNLTGHNSINDFINGWAEADKIISSKNSKENLRERGAYFNSKTGYSSNVFTIGNNDSYNLSDEIYKTCLEEVDTFIHSHPEKYASMSLAVFDENTNEINGDISAFYFDYLKGIGKQLIRGMDEIEVFDAEKFFSDYANIFNDIDTDSKKRDDLSKKLLVEKDKVANKLANNIYYYLKEIVDEYGTISESSSLSDILVDKMTPDNTLIVKAISEKFNNKDINAEFLKHYKTKGSHSSKLGEEFSKFIFSSFNKLDFNKLINSYDSIGISKDKYLEIVEKFKQEVSSSFYEYFKKAFNLPDFTWEDLSQINYRMATPEILEKALGVKEFAKYTKVYSNQDWNEKNPLGLQTQSLSGIFDNTGIEKLNEQFPDLLSNIKSIETAISSVADILRNVFNIPSELEIDNQFEKIRSKFYEIANIDGSFDARRKELKELISEYQTYLDMGGKQPITDLTENEKSQNKLVDLFNKNSSQSIKEEQQSFVSLSISAEEAAKAKEKFVEANKDLRASADSSIHSIKEESSVLSNINQSSVLSNQTPLSSNNIEGQITNAISEIDKKTEAFKNEEKVVSQVIPSEVENIKSLILVLENVKSLLLDISENVQKLDLSNLGDIDKLNKLKSSNIKKISTSLSSFVESINGITLKDGNILSSLQDILSRSDELKNLASTLKATSTQINAVKGNTKLQTSQNLLTGSEDDIRYFGVESLQKDNLSVLSTTLKATSKGTVELIALVRDLNNEFKEYTLSTSNGVNFTTLKVEEGTVSLEKQAVAWNALHDVINKSSDVSMIPDVPDAEFIDDSSQTWKDITNAAKDYKDELGEIVSIVRSIRQNKEGEILESFKITGSNGNSVTIGAELEKVALKQTMLDVSQINKYIDETLVKLNKLDNEKYLESFRAELEEVKAKLIDFKSTKLVFEGNISPELVGDFNMLQSTVDNLFNNEKSSKLANGAGYNNLLGKVYKTMYDNTMMSKTLRKEFEALASEMERIGKDATDEQFKKWGATFKHLTYEMEKSKKTGRSFFDLVINKSRAMSASLIAQYLSFYDLIRIMRQGFETIKEYDKALTEMNKVSDESISTLKEFQKESFELADAIGATASAVQNSTADWLRLGESLQEAAKSAEATNILFNVSEFESIDKATDSLVSMSQAYKDLEKMDIVDIMNNIGNNYAISTDGLASALQRSASALTTAGNDINEAVALITAGNAVVQDADSVGTGMQTIALRLVGTKEAKDQLEELGEETDGVITTISKLRDTILSATKAASEDGKGFDILDANGNYKSTYEIMYGLADMYDEIVKKDKELGTNNLNLLLETLAGELICLKFVETHFYRTHLIARVA